MLRLPCSSCLEERILSSGVRGGFTPPWLLLCLAQPFLEPAGRTRPELGRRRKPGSEAPVPQVCAGHVRCTRDCTPEPSAAAEGNLRSLCVWSF